MAAEMSELIRKKAIRWSVRVKEMSLLEYQ